MRLTRRQVLVGAATSGLGAVGLYELVDRLTSSPAMRSHGRLHAEQHLLDGLAVMRDNGVAVSVPPLHHAVITAGVVTDDLRGAQRKLEQTLLDLERRYAPTPAGLGVTVAWGLPYFRRHVPRQADVHLPVDLRASRTRSRTTRALTDAIRFPSDPAHTILEANDVAVLLRSDVRAHIEDAERALFHGSSILHATSIRRGFVGSDFLSGPSLAKRMAQAAGIDGAELIPDDAQLFLGFTSTQKAALGPRRIANFETLGYVDLGERGYFRNGTHMHLSHVFEDLASWYQTFDFQERVDTAFKPGLEAKPGVVTVSQGPHEAASAGSLRRGFHRDGRIRVQAGDRGPATRRLQYPRQPVRLELEPGTGRDAEYACCGSPLRGLQSDERRLPSQSPRNGRRPARRHPPSVRAPRSQSGLQRRTEHLPPTEFPRSPTTAPLVPAGRALNSRRTPGRASTGSTRVGEPLSGIFSGRAACTPPRGAKYSPSSKLPPKGHRGL